MQLIPILLSTKGMKNLFSGYTMHHLIIKIILQVYIKL